MRDDLERLLDIRDAIARIEKYTAHGRTTFEQEELIQTWVVHYLAVIGEAVRALSAEFRAAQAQVPWSDIVGMRNILIHHYFEIDVEAVWAAVEHDLPPLKAQTETILRQMDQTEDQ